MPHGPRRSICRIRCRIGWAAAWLPPRITRLVRIAWSASCRVCAMSQTVDICSNGRGLGEPRLQSPLQSNLFRRNRRSCRGQWLAGIQSVWRSRTVTGWGAAVYQFNRNWFGGAMIYYQRLTGSAANSPIVTQRATRNQITYGVGVEYPFRWALPVTHVTSCNRTGTSQRGRFSSSIMLNRLLSTQARTRRSLPSRTRETQPSFVARQERLP